MNIYNETNFVEILKYGYFNFDHLLYGIIRVPSGLLQFYEQHRYNYNVFTCNIHYQSNTA